VDLGVVEFDLGEGLIDVAKVLADALVAPVDGRFAPTSSCSAMWNSTDG
jgi:hypothetical protein